MAHPCSEQEKSTPAFLSVRFQENQPRAILRPEAQAFETLCLCRRRIEKPGEYHKVGCTQAPPPSPAEAVDCHEQPDCRHAGTTGLFVLPEPWDESPAGTSGNRIHALVP